MAAAARPIAATLGGMRHRWSFAVLLLVGCGTTQSTPDAAADAALESGANDSGADATRADGGASDGGVLDATASDGGFDAGACSGAQDCRLHSSYCSTAPCQCFPLRATEPDPKCEGTPITCFADPCMGKVATCSSGTCGVQ